MDSISFIAAETGIAQKQIASTIKLLDDGATIPFISRYRKAIGCMGGHKTIPSAPPGRQQDHSLQLRRMPRPEPAHHILEKMNTGPVGQTDQNHYAQNRYPPGIFLTVTINNQSYQNRVQRNPRPSTADKRHESIGPGRMPMIDSQRNIPIQLF